MTLWTSRLWRSLCKREVHPAEHYEDGKPIEICWLFAKHGHAPENTRRDSEVIEEREARGSHDSDRLEEQHVERGIYRHGGSQRPELGWIGRRNALGRSFFRRLSASANVAVSGFTSP